MRPPCVHQLTPNIAAGPDKLKAPGIRRRDGNAWSLARGRNILLELRVLRQWRSGSGREIHAYEGKSAYKSGLTSRHYGIEWQNTDDA